MELFSKKDAQWFNRALLTLVVLAVIGIISIVAAIVWGIIQLF